MPRLLRPAAALFLAAALALALAACGSGSRPAIDLYAGGSVVSVKVDRSAPVGTSRLALGVTHAQYSLDPYGNAAAIARGRSHLEGWTTYQNQHIYGWGAVNPEPTPGAFDWHSLDRRMSLIRSLHATPVITLCCAPDWMTSLRATSSRYPNLPPTDAHVRDFADLAARVARRYPDVRHFLVWNEMKGYWNHKLRRWDYAAYTRLYNAVYSALKAVNPAIQVGGPYLIVQGTGTRDLGKGHKQAADPITRPDKQALEYWLEHKRGADFIAIDRNVTPGKDRSSYSPGETLALAHWFGDIATQVRAMTSLPIWYAESHMDGGRNWRYQAAGVAAMLISEVRAGVAVSLQWQPQGNRGDPNRGNDQNLFSDTRVPGGGRPFPSLGVYRLIHRVFPPGTLLYRSRSSSPGVLALASARWTVLTNLRATRVTVRIGRSTLHLAPYEVVGIRSSR